MRLMIACGGTGGHIYPALAVAEAFASAGGEVTFVGSESGPEAQMIPQAGYSFQGIPVAGLRGKSPAALARGLVVLPRALLRSCRHLRAFRPDAVLGTGGFASGPVLIASVVKRVPTVIQEQNRRLGFTNRVLARFVSEVAVSFTETADELGRGVVTGNPVRREFFRIPAVRPERDRLRLLVFGGSQGSHTLNTAMTAALPALSELAPKLHVHHQTGRREYDTVRSAYDTAGAPDEWTVEPYIDPMADAFAAADLVLCRSGASTVAELCAAGRGSILVPYPHATGDHQMENARTLEAHGAAQVVPDRELDGVRVTHLVRRYLADPDSILRMGEFARSLARPGASDKIAGLLRALGGGESA